MPSWRSKIAAPGLTALSAVGLTLVASAWLGLGTTTAIQGLAMLVIGAAGFIVRAIAQAGNSGQEQRREIMGKLNENAEGGSESTAEALLNAQDEIARLTEQLDTQRTRIYAEATAEILNAIKQGVPTKRPNGQVALLLPKPYPPHGEPLQVVHGRGSMLN